MMVDIPGREDPGERLSWFVYDSSDIETLMKTHGGVVS
jgi:hypothetical protein